MAGESIEEIFKEGYNIYEIVEYILEKHKIITIEESGEMRLYQNGYYKRDMKRRINKVISDTLKDKGLKFNLSRRNAIIQLIENETLESVKEFDKDLYILNLSNCLLDIKTNKQKEHTSDYLSSRRIPITYDPEAKCPNITKFLKEVFQAGDLPFILEYSALSLTPLMIYQKALMLYGSGNNGKSTFLNLLNAFVGTDNTSTVDPSQLNKGTIAWTLENKTLNFVSDMETKKFKVRKFNQYIGNEAKILIDRKFKDPYHISPTAKMIYTCNETFPEVELDTDKGFWRKWVLLFCMNSFDGIEDEHILDKLTTRKELSGFLNLCILSFKKLHKKGKFTIDQDWEEVKDYWLQKLNIISSFIEEKTINNNSSEINKDIMLSNINNYLKTIGKRYIFTKATLTRRMHELGYKSSRKTNVYYGLKLKIQTKNEQSTLKINK